MIERPDAGSLRLLAVGPAREADLRYAAEQLGQLAECRWADSPSAAVRLLKEDRPPHWIGLLQSRPGQFDRRVVERLHAAAPLARLFLITGSWSEGETRSGHPLSGVIRVPWHHLPFALLAERDAWIAGDPSSWSLPRTARPVDRLEWRSETPLHCLRDETLRTDTAAEPSSRRTVMILAEQRESFESIAGMCRALDHTGMWARTPRDAETSGEPLIWVWGTWSDGSAALAARWYREAPRLILTDFPRADACRDLHASGWHVAGRPISLEYLAAWLGHYPAAR